jgi:hypothetical protein
MSRDDDPGIPIEGEPYRKVRVYQMGERGAVGVVAEYEDDDDPLRRHRQRLDRHEAVLVRKVGEQVRLLPLFDEWFQGPEHDLRG